MEADEDDFLNRMAARYKGGRYNGGLGLPDELLVIR